MEEFEEPIISLFSKGETIIRRKLCTDVAKICDSEDFLNEDGVNNDKDNKIEINDEL